MLALDKQLTLIKTDCLTLLSQLPDQSIDAIVTDPPYFNVKSENWDRQWKKEADFLIWLEQVVIELARVLKRNGSFYMFCGTHLEHKVQTVIDRHFNVLNRIMWVKKGGKHNGCNPLDLRRYFPQTESIIFAEHSNALKRSQYVCEPICQYLQQQWKAAGFKYSDAEKLVGSVARHYFSRSQWHMPTREKYELMQKHVGIDYLKQGYDELLAIKNDATRPDQSHMRQFKLTRPANLIDRPHTNIWNFAPVQYYEGKHVCEKPQPLLEHIILTSTKPNDLILDVFVGSCSTAKTALKLKRRFIGCDLDDTYFDQLKELLPPNF